MCRKIKLRATRWWHILVKLPLIFTKRQTLAITGQYISSLQRNLFNFFITVFSLINSFVWYTKYSIDGFYKI